MRLIVGILMALGLLIITQTRAFAVVHIDVDLTSQTMHVRSDSGANYAWPISSGRSGHLTPRGAFRPRALYTMVHSAKYGNAPMPHSIFFYGQYAIHGTDAVGSLGHPASHGCVRLSPDHAATLFVMVQAQGAAIRIVGTTETAVAHRSHRSDLALAFSPARHARTLNQWARNPVAR